MSIKSFLYKNLYLTCCSTARKKLSIEACSRFSVIRLPFCCAFTTCKWQRKSKTHAKLLKEKNDRLSILHLGFYINYVSKKLKEFCRKPFGFLINYTYYFSVLFYRFENIRHISLKSSYFLTRISWPLRSICIKPLSSIIRMISSNCSYCLNAPVNGNSFSEGSS